MTAGPRVLFMDTIWHYFQDEIRAALRQRFDVLVSGCGFAGAEEKRRQAEFLRTAEVIVSSLLSPEQAGCAANVKLVHSNGAGIDGIAREFLPVTTRLCKTGNHGRAIARYILMVMQALTTRLFHLDRALRNNHWLNPQFSREAPFADDLEGKTALVVGTGEIGNETARLCSAYGMNTIGVHFPGYPPTEGLYHRLEPSARLHEAIPEADFLVMAVALVPETEGIIGEQALRLMKKDAFLINTARGPLVSEEHLFRALQSGAIAGAALDVWYHYPAELDEMVSPSSYPFHTLDNVIMTPHSSGTTHLVFCKRLNDIIDNIRAWSAGRPLKNEIAGEASR